MQGDFVSVGARRNGLGHQCLERPGGRHLGNTLDVLLKRQHFDDSHLAVLDGELDLAPQVTMAVVRDLHRLRERDIQRISR